MRTTTPSQLYEADFYAWTKQQASELRRLAKTRPNLPLDLEHIAEEIQDLGKSEHDTVYSLARQIIQHLLLIEHSPATEQRRHWMDEIDEFHAQMKRKLSATIRRDLRRDFGEVYADGWRVVERKMRRYGEDRAAAALPAKCPYAVEQVLGHWLPDTGPAWIALRAGRAARTALLRRMPAEQGRADGGSGCRSKNSRRSSGSGFPSICAMIMPRWSVSSNGGFAAVRTPPSASGFHDCWSKRREGSSTAGPTGHDRGSR